MSLDIFPTVNLIELVWFFLVVSSLPAHLVLRSYTVSAQKALNNVPDNDPRCIVARKNAGNELGRLVLQTLSLMAAILFMSVPTNQASPWINYGVCLIMIIKSVINLVMSVRDLHAQRQIEQAVLELLDKESNPNGTSNAAEPTRGQADNQEPH